MLFSISANIDSDILNITAFSLKSEEFYEKKIKIKKIIHTPYIRYVVSSINPNYQTIYVLINSGSNYFFSINTIECIITELSNSTEIGLAPTLQIVNDRYIIAIGGKFSDCINIYDIENDKWNYIGKLSCPRYGSYALFNEYDNIIYIAGGINEKEDNSLDIEYFLFNPEFMTQIKQKKLKDDYLLRKINPVVIPIFDFNTYIICGGAGIWGDVNTCTIFYTDKDTILLSNTTLPKAISTENHNIYIYKGAVYFFINESEVMKYNSIDNTYDLIINRVAKTA